MRAEVAVAERLGRACPRSRRLIVCAAWMPRLHRDLGHAREAVERHQVADDEDLRVPGQRAVRRAPRPGPRGRSARRRARPAAGRAARPATPGRPDLRRGLDRRSPFDVERRIASTPVTRVPRRISTPSRSRSRCAPAGAAGRGKLARIVVGRRRAARSAPSAGSKRRKLSLQRAARQLGDLAGHLDAGRARRRRRRRSARPAARRGRSRSSAISKAPKIRPRSSRASSIVFMPGA